MDECDMFTKEIKARLKEAKQFIYPYPFYSTALKETEREITDTVPREYCK